MASQRKRAQNKKYSNNAKEWKAKAKASYTANPEKERLPPKLAIVLTVRKRLPPNLAIVVTLKEGCL